MKAEEWCKEALDLLEKFKKDNDGLREINGLLKKQVELLKRQIEIIENNNFNAALNLAKVLK